MVPCLAFIGGINDLRKPMRSGELTARKAIGVELRICTSQGEQIARVLIRICHGSGESTFAEYLPQAQTPLCGSWQLELIVDYPISRLSSSRDQRIQYRILTGEVGVVP